MENCKNNYCLAFQQVKHTVRKPPHKGTPNPAVHKAISKTELLL
jgi:hypothetical protein